LVGHAIDLSPPIQPNTFLIAAAAVIACLTVQLFEEYIKDKIKN
jgi:hypothetical protein